MKISLLLALVGFVLSFALPTFAQQPTPDPQLRQLVVALVKKYDAAINANDATAVAAFYTEDAIYVPDTRPINGREAIEKSFAHLKRNPRTGEVRRVPGRIRQNASHVPAYAAGNTLCLSRRRNRDDQCQV
jgi:uncharacterized protein (TIGR02246 family)